MDKCGEIVASELKQLKLKNSFRRSVSCLLANVTIEDFSRVFPNFTGAQQDRLYQLYIQIIMSLHEHMQDSFDSTCHEKQVGTILDTVEHLVEQQSLDPLFSQKTNLGHVKHDLLAAKKNEVRLLEDMLEKVEEQKHTIKARIKLLTKTCEETPGITDAVEKLRAMTGNHASYSARPQDS